MKLELKTERLLLTPLTQADFDLCSAIWTDPVVVEYICDAATAEELRAEMPDVIRRGGNGGIGIWCVADGHPGDVL